MNTNRAGYLPHSGVMVEELTSIVETLPKGVFIDATYGYGSHIKVLKQFNNLDHPAKPRWPLDEDAAFLKGAGVKL